MPRYIDADALENDILDRYCEPCKRDHKDSKGPFCLICGYKHMIEGVRDAPAADVQKVKHGHWIIAWDGEITCSVCGEVNPVHLMQNFPFCPYCGAEMDEEEEHEVVSFEEEETDDTDSEASV